MEVGEGRGEDRCVGPVLAGPSMVDALSLSARSVSLVAGGESRSAVLVRAGLGGCTPGYFTIPLAPSLFPTSYLTSVPVLVLPPTTHQTQHRIARNYVSSLRSSTPAAREAEKTLHGSAAASFYVFVTSSSVAIPFSPVHGCSHPLQQRRRKIFD